MKSTTSETQTEVTHSALMKLEQSLEIKQNELEIQAYKDKQDLMQKERQVLRRERDLDIRERITEEKKVEYSYKQRELNQRLKQAISYPLSCLENEAKLGEKLREIKMTPDLFKGLQLESDPSFA